ncbi:MAG TPA: hypothetical protein DEP24_09375, partial [Mycobacterium sp.]|nr:hypothetical protein [Mycobacterium sp.]
MKEFASRDWPAFARLLAEILPGHVKYAWDKSEADRSHFKMWQAAGVTILPNHFYSPIPDVSGISDAELTARLPMHGIDMRVDAQLALLADLASYKQEYCAFRSRAPNTYGLFYFGGALPPIDAELLYAMVRKLKPARVRELGAGFSTLVIAEAVLRNEAEGHPCDFISIDPYPGDLVSGDLKGRSAHISKKAEHV